MACSIRRRIDFSSRRLPATKLEYLSRDRLGSRALLAERSRLIRVGELEPQLGSPYLPGNREFLDCTKQIQNYVIMRLQMEFELRHFGRAHGYLPEFHAGARKRELQAPSF